MKRKLLIPLFIALSLSACVSEDAANKEQIEETAEIHYFKENENTKYTLYLPEKGYINITDYVIDSTDRNIRVSSDFIENVLDYKKLDRAEPDSEGTFLEFQNENANLLQLEVGGKNIIHDGKIFMCANEMAGDQSRLELNLNDALFAIGYQKMDQSLSDNNLITIAYWDIADESMSLPMDENGNIISDVDALVNYKGTPSDAIPAESEIETDSAQETSAETIEAASLEEASSVSESVSETIEEETENEEA